MLSRSIRKNIKGSMMTFAPDAYLDRARTWAERLERLAMVRGAESRLAARAVVSRETRVAAGTIENLLNGRLKTVAAYVYDRLAAGLARAIDREIEALEHEKHVALASDLGARDSEIQEMDEALARLRSLRGERDNRLSVAANSRCAAPNGGV